METKNLNLKVKGLKCKVLWSFKETLEEKIQSWLDSHEGEEEIKAILTLNVQSVVVCIILYTMK